MTVSTFELEQMRADALTLSDEDSGLSVEITIYRGATVLDAQSVRLVSGDVSRDRRMEGTEAAQGDVLVIGAVELDIQSRDRFKVNGITYEVTAVRPNRYVQTVAQARLLQ